MSAIETLICRIEMSLIGSISFGFAQNTIHYFRNTVLNSYWYCLPQMPQKYRIEFIVTLASTNATKKKSAGNHHYLPSPQCFIPNER